MQKVIVLTCQSEAESAKRLGFTTHTYLYNDIDKLDHDVVIRWGHGVRYRDQMDVMREFKHVINRANDIRLNCNKYLSSKKLARVVPTPKVWINPPKRKLVVYRPMAHSGGKDFSVKMTPIEQKEGYYATEFVNSDREVRVWYCGNRLLYARRVTKNKTRLQEKFKCRSLWGYEFIDKIPKTLRKYVCKAIKFLGFYSGAFDILYYKGKYLFLENNTAPSLDHPIVIKFFKEGFAKIVDKKMSLISKELKINPPLEIAYTINQFYNAPDFINEINELEG